MNNRYRSPRNIVRKSTKLVAEEKPLSSESETDPEKPVCRLELNLTPIEAKGQYGKSYEASARRGKHGWQKSSVTIARSEDVVDKAGHNIVEFRLHRVTTNQKQAPLGDFFIKCPDPRADEAEQTEFRKEFDSGTSINLAAKHLAEKRAQPHPTAPFSIPRMICHGTKVDHSGEKSPCLLYEYVSGKMIHEAGWPSDMNRGLGSKQSFDGSADLVNKETNPFTDARLKDSSNDVLKFARGLARAVQVVHNQGIVHSFLVPRNILWRVDPTEESRFDFSGAFSIVGFGYARLCDAQGKVFRNLEISQSDSWFRAPETRQQDTSTAYWFAADIYSIGAILFYLLLRAGGDNDEAATMLLKNIPVDRRRLKEHVAKELWRAMPETIRGNENILKIIDSCLRFDQDQRYSCVEELLDAIDLAQSAGTRRKGNVVSVDTKDDDDEKVMVQLFSMTSSSASWRDESPAYVGHFQQAIARELLQKFGNIRRGHLEIYGSRDRIVHSLCALLGSANDGDTYETVTLPEYWTDENLGSTGRFLTMNKHMVRKGVNIRRVFLVSAKNFHSLPESDQVILEAQLQAWNALEDEREKKEAKTKRVEPTKFEMFVKPVGVEEIAKFEAIGSTVAYLHRGSTPSPKQAVCLNFFSSAKAQWNKGKVFLTRTITKVRYWWPQDPAAEERFKKNVDKFRGYWQDGQTLKNYVLGNRARHSIGDAIGTVLGLAMKTKTD